MTHSISIRSLCLMTAIGLCGARPLTSAQTPGISRAATPGNGYRIAGTVVSKTDGHPLARARIIVRDTKTPQKFESLVTSEDGRFEFAGVPAGKYDLNGAKRGYISASYDQHEQFSTAIVTGAGLDTQALVLRLAPTAIISGKILDESGDPVRHATVTVYYDDHSSGVDQIRQYRGAQTDDEGAYEVAGVMPGTYFLSASAKPWYAVHPRSNSPGSVPDGKPADTPNVDRSFDVAYPLTYYADVTEADSATPIPIRGGERLQVEIHLNPVPSLHLLFRVPSNGTNGYSVPRLEQPAFDSSTFLLSDGVRTISPGVVELTGIPAGRYNVRLNGPGPAIQMNGVDLSKDGEEIDTSSGEALSTVKVSVQVPGEATLPPQLTVGLRSGSRAFAGVQPFSPKGEAELAQIAAGRYEVLVWGSDKQYSIAKLSAEGAEVSGHSLIVTAGSSPSVSLTVVGGSLNVEGTAKRASKPFAGAMVVLVPKNPEGNRDLFRRDQSDLDGTFNLLNVVPGSYTVLAIENGWDLDWSQPAVIAAYVNRGRPIEVGNHFGRTMNLSEPVEVQSK
ncbi:MAG: carboxypeptidase-like regulatory domain-containing protein [Candidatus Sulfotelmatobacter sp.]